MKLPLIKHISNFVSENDEDFIIETLEVLEHITEYSGIKDDEIDLLGELISNLYGASRSSKRHQSRSEPKRGLECFYETSPRQYRQLTISLL